MATWRCSGDVRMRVSYKGDDNYNVEMRTPATSRRCTLRGVRLSPYQRGRIASDSAAAFNKIAEAAIAFADGLSRKDGGCPDLEAGNWARWATRGGADRYTITTCKKPWKGAS